MSDYMYGIENALKNLAKKRGEKIPDKPFENGVSSQVVKLCIEAMSRNIDNMSAENKIFYH